MLRFYIAGIMVGMKEIRNTFVQKWNGFLQNLKLGEPYRQCAAINLGNGARCTKLTSHRLCTSHWKMSVEFCRLYHLVENPKYLHVAEGVLAEVELDARLKYEKQFDIKENAEHAFWKQYLRRIIDVSKLKACLLYTSRCV